jgi:hypothetical protein
MANPVEINPAFKRKIKEKDIQMMPKNNST